VNKPANAPDSISTPQKHGKPPDSPIGPAKWCLHKPNSCSGHMDGSTAHTDVQSIRNDVEMAENMTKNVRMHQNGSMMQSSSNGHEIVTPELPK